MKQSMDSPVSELERLSSFEARMLRNFRAAIDDWDDVCSGLGRWEAQHLTGANSGSALTQHRYWVEELLCWGCLVQKATQQLEFPDKALAARVDDRLRHLQDKLALWHAAMSDHEQDRILSSAFE